MKKILLSLLLMFSVLNADLFERGNTSFGGVIGSGYSGNESYMILGVSADYFVLNGLSVGVGYQGWFGADPTQNQLTLSSNYYIPLNNKFRPYLGAFFRETFISGYEDRSSYGGRAGLAVTMSPNTYISAGWAYEEYTNCPRFLECSSSYPEFVFSLAF